MQAHVEHLAALPEDLLRAVAVVEVDVQDRHALGAAGEQRLGDDRGVVEEAVAADEVPSGVVPGRPAQAVGQPRAALEDAVQRRQADVDRRPRGSRGPGDDRGGGVEAVRAEAVVPSGDGSWSSGMRPA